MDDGRVSGYFCIGGCWIDVYLCYNSFFFFLEKKGIIKI